MSEFQGIPEEQLEAVLKQLKLEEKQKREAKLGRKLGQWGGRRPNAGRPVERTHYNVTAKLTLTPVQKKILAEMGEGSISEGLQKLISEYM